MSHFVPENSELVSIKYKDKTKKANTNKYQYKRREEKRIEKIKGYAKR
jgi:hypothetical protein